MAIEANSSARSLCKDDQVGIKDLEQQHLKFTEMAEPKGIFTLRCDLFHDESITNQAETPPPRLLKLVFMCFAFSWTAEENSQ